MNEYATPVDIWSIGCIFAELAINQPLFKGENDNSQLEQIFRIKGLPTEESWPGIRSNPQISMPRWPNYEPFDLRELIRPE
mmetsp:Transcript_16972/g.22857  ORF Transcript_16972/g.22857 Transcript_16972/m.22857 type:complete len:81 (-) Transcript_16972:212-454(-)|eukprot:CAMPEP_0185586980 /NCGR_PEP_ID=MMETSP0434-20130131/46978_1 /TAXON_ID=626734 ORGANISM="Favella taraikaensis, Strain Fe Narragansett Bay" /NCGR_SAMPLE_ID=MMETSP0434 /ASSEMBLY_ACC=CAM_ASM_000379 /LENGTH=80 /DNA_ID=CAMNT_0028208509 /DNA_START=596 /DNA_END=838 /DNA_ORIENTATION=+